jgi:hypothetical protein
MKAERPVVRQLKLAPEAGAAYAKAFFNHVFGK